MSARGPGRTWRTPGRLLSTADGGRHLKSGVSRLTPIVARRAWSSVTTTEFHGGLVEIVSPLHPQHTPFESIGVRKLQPCATHWPRGI